MRRETLTLTAAEVRFATDEAGTFSGYASVFGGPDSFGDTIRPGAFRKTLAEHRRQQTAPGMFWNHDPDRPIGVWSSLEENARGLKVAGQLVTETMQGHEAHLLLRAGAVSGPCTGFRARSSERGTNGGRVLTYIELVEISLVSLPAASKARVTNVKGAADTAGAAAFVEAVRRAALAIKRHSP